MKINGLVFRQPLRLVDCSSFQVMRQLGIQRAFAIDRHFREQGFDLLEAVWLKWIVAKMIQNEGVFSRFRGE